MLLAYILYNAVYNFLQQSYNCLQAMPLYVHMYVPPQKIISLRRTRHTLDFATATTIATVLVHSCLDYCNSLYHSLPVTQINRLQHIKNGLARAVTRTPKHSHISPVLKSLHWLKDEQRIQYVIISITHNLL